MKLAGAKERFRMLDEPDMLMVFAGEAYGPFYREWIDKVRELPDLKIRILAGPQILLEPQKYDQYFANGTIRDRSDYLNVHPVFEFMKDHPDRIEVRIKRTSLFQERHFAVGKRSSRIFCEFYHGDNRSHGGIMFAPNSALADRKETEFERMWNNQSFCTRLTTENYSDVLSDVAFAKGQ